VNLGQGGRDRLEASLVPGPAGETSACPMPSARRSSRRCRRSGATSRGR